MGVAARVWRHASMAESTRSAIAKLRAAGVEPDASQLASLEPSVQASEPGFEVLWNAVLDRARVSFTYRDGSPRTLEPWGLTSFQGRWYVIGRDVDRAATRMFKLSRMTDLPEEGSRAGSYEVPADLDLRRLARSLAPREPTETAVLAIRAGKAPALARRGEPAHFRRQTSSRLRGVRRRLRRSTLSRGGNHPVCRRCRGPGACRAAGSRLPRPDRCR